MTRKRKQKAQGTPREVVSNSTLRWIPVEAPKVWNPTRPGSSIEGVVTSIIQKDGKYGTYTEYVISGYDEARIVRGTRIQALMASGDIQTGTMVKVVYQGSTPMIGLPNDRKEYALYRGEY